MQWSLYHLNYVISKYKRHLACKIYLTQSFFPQKFLLKNAICIMPFISQQPLENKTNINKNKVHLLYYR